MTAQVILKVLVAITGLGIGLFGALIISSLYSSHREFKTSLLNILNTEKYNRQKDIRLQREEIDKLRQEIGQIWLEIMEMNRKDKK